jgi:hypothetical protein
MNKGAIGAHGDNSLAPVSLSGSNIGAPNMGRIRAFHGLGERLTLGHGLALSANRPSTEVRPRVAVTNKVRKTPR